MAFLDWLFPWRVPRSRRVLALSAPKALPPAPAALPAGGSREQPDPPPTHAAISRGFESRLRAPRSAEGRRRALSTAFDASHPVSQRNGLYGRAQELDELLDSVLTQEQHAIVHGARGSGKTSLVRIFGDHADQHGSFVIYTACETGMRFADLVQPFVREVGPSLHPAERAAAIGFPDPASTDFTPRALVEYLAASRQRLQQVLILDEFDRVEDRQVHAEVATFMKLASDALLPLRLIVVGIARSVGDLIACHPSLRRHMTVLAVGRIARSEAERLIAHGSRAADMPFDEAARDLIIDVACGSPYHLRLFCLYAGRAALDREGDHVSVADTIEGLRRATARWAQTNAADHALFQHLSIGSIGEDRARIARFAMEAAHKDRLLRAIADAEVMALLGPALEAEGRAGEMTSFRDTSAPQFLLAMLASEERPIRKQGAAPAERTGTG